MNIYELEKQAENFYRSLNITKDIFVFVDKKGNCLKVESNSPLVHSSDSNDFALFKVKYENGNIVAKLQGINNN